MALNVENHSGGAGVFGEGCVPVFVTIEVAGVLIGLLVPELKCLVFPCVIALLATLGGAAYTVYRSGSSSKE